ncbi:MAG: starch-binding protein [Treponema sp.]|jgi:fibronectin type 3 domain-containing protein|nr:starch-binding protein [Treponema sp.]
MKNKPLFTGICGMMLTYGLLLAGCGNPAAEDTAENNPPVNSPHNAVTVYMQKPAGWSQVYAYVWDDAGAEYSESGAGTLLTDQSGGYYSFRADSPEYGYINVRFNDGGSQSTLDILGVGTDTYYQSAGTYGGSPSKTILRAGETAAVTAPDFKASAVTDSTVTLTWDPIPGIDGYILYDEWVEFDENEEEIPNSEYWHFQKAFIPSEKSILDDNYGEYLDPEAVYTWRLVAVKYKDNADLNSLGRDKDSDYLKEDDYAPYYHVVYDFGKLEVETRESSLSAPTNLRVAAVEAASVELAWNEVPNADYYMVWWWNDGSDGRDEGWYYIEEAYANKYLDNNEEFIFPDSTYKYMVVAHNKQTYSKDSQEVSVHTLLDQAGSIQGINPITRAAAPDSPSIVQAGANPFAANQINVSWYSVSGATKYEIGLFTSSGASTPVSGTKKTVSGAFSGMVYYTYTSVPTSKGAYYVGVKAINGNKSSVWRYTSAAVSAFPKISIQSATSKISGGYKTITVKMNASWKTGASYSYEVTVTDPQGYGAGYTYTKTFSNTNTIAIPNIPKGPKYTVSIRPSTSGVYGNTLTKSNL